MKKTLNKITGLLMTLFSGFLFAFVLGVNPLFTIAALFTLSFFMPVIPGVAMYNFANMLWGDGNENMGGVKTIIYYAPIADIDNFPALPTSPATAEEEVTLEGNFDFLAGKYFFKLYTTQETSEVVDENQGEVDGQSFVQKSTVFFPGTAAEALAFAKAVNNSNMVFVITESTGLRRVIGSEAFPAKCKPSFTTGKATADRKGMTMEIQSYGYTPAPIYNGVIRLDGESIS